MDVKYKGKIIFVLGPTGSGKSTLFSMLKKRCNEFLYPLSVVTRPIREGEVEGREYKFVTEDKFEKMIEKNLFLEYAKVHSKGYYGTLKSDILDAINQGKIAIKLIDYQGLILAKKALPKDLVKSIFIMPPSSLKILEKRIRKRANISDEEVKKRLESVKLELLNLDLYDIKLKIIDGDIEKSYELFEKEILKLI